MQPKDAAPLLLASNAPWWIAGGWAIDVFRGQTSRPHTDLDVGILRVDAPTVLQALSTWQIFEARDGQLTRLDPGCVPRPDVRCL